jgi:ABC-type nitrate/sulfonate/bicarbonate transport system permease component
LLGAIVAEFVGASKGVGAFMLGMSAQMHVAGTFALLVVLAIYGTCVQILLRKVRRRLLFWAQAERLNKI